MSSGQEGNALSPVVKVPTRAVSGFVHSVIQQQYQSPGPLSLLHYSWCRCFQRQAGHVSSKPRILTPTLQRHGPSSASLTQHGKEAIPRDPAAHLPSRCTGPNWVTCAVSGVTLERTVPHQQLWKQIWLRWKRLT